MLTASSGLQVMAEFRRHSSDADPALRAANLQLAKDYNFLLRSIREHKVSLSAACQSSRACCRGLRPLIVSGRVSWYLCTVTVSAWPTAAVRC